MLYTASAARSLYPAQGRGRMYAITCNNSVSLFPLRITGGKPPSGRVFMLSIYRIKSIVSLLVSGTFYSCFQVSRLITATGPHDKGRVLLSRVIDPVPFRRPCVSSHALLLRFRIAAAAIVAARGFMARGSVVKVRRSAVFFAAYTKYHK